MRFLNEFREDMRLVRLNNPGLGFIFKTLDFTAMIVKLVLLAAFGLGIWHVLFNLNISDTAMQAKKQVSAPDQAAVAAVWVGTARPEAGGLKPERIEMLRQFASENRVPVAEQASVDVVKSATESAVDQHSIAEPDSTEIVVADIAPLPDQQTLSKIPPPLELNINGVFDAVEKKLRLPLESAGLASVEDSSTVLVAVNLVPEPLVTASLATVPSGSNVDDNGEINVESWILAQDADRFIIQIASTSNRPFLVGFARQLPKGEPVSIYNYAIGDRTEHGLSYGLFDSRAAAEAALEQLSQRTRRYGAYARKLDIIQQQVKQLVEEISVSRN